MTTYNKILSKARFISCIASLLILITAVASSNAQTPLSGKNLSNAVTKITSGYTPWSSAGWNAKVKSDILPLSITAKVYMKRDSLTLISLRVPLMGEVARVEIDNSAMLIINKMKKRYAKIDLSRYGDHPARVHSDIQEILVGRAAIIGAGTLSKKNVDMADIYEMPGQGWLISCRLPKEYGGFNYGYAINLDAQIMNMITTKGKTTEASAPAGMESTITKISFEAATDITYSSSSANANISAHVGGKSYQCSFEGIKLEYGTAGFDRLNIAKNYSQCSLKEAISF